MFRSRIAKLLWCFSLNLELRRPVAKFDFLLCRVGVSDALALAARNRALPFNAHQPYPPAIPSAPFRSRLFSDITIIVAVAVAVAVNSRFATRDSQFFCSLPN